ncbi:MAG: TonB-dependent receptor, partial [Pseudomonadota bacterium]
MKLNKFTNRLVVTTLLTGVTLGLNVSLTFAQETQLDEISIFATAGGETNAFEFPGQVSVIDREEIDSQAAARPADIFQGTPGVEFDGGPRRSGQVPSIRGQQGESVVILLDDARQSFVSGHDGRFFVDPDILQAAEVIKGPTSSIYGSGAIGGVFAFRTLEAGDILTGDQQAAAKVKWTGQSVDDEFRYSATIVARNEERTGEIVGNIGYSTSDDIKLGDGSTLANEDEIGSAFLKTILRPSEAWKWTTSWIYFNRNAADGQNPQGAGTITAGNPEVARSALSQTLQSKLEYNPANNELIDSKLVVYGASNDVEEPEVLSGRTTTRKVDTVGFKADNRSRFTFGPSITANWTYGVDIYQDSQKGEDSTSADGTRGGVPNAESDFTGLFTEMEIDLGKPGIGLGQLSLIPGLRYDKFESRSAIAADTSETAFSPKIAVAYRPVEWLSLFGNFGEAFRAPSFNESYAIGRHFSFGPATNEFIPNPDLKPEDATGWEAGASLQFASILSSGDRFRIKGSYWENDVDDLINLQVIINPGCFGAPFNPPCFGVGGAGTSQSVNIANAELNGLELEASYDSTYFALKATYSEIDGRDADTGEFVGSLFADKFDFDAAFKLPDYDARIGARATFASDFDKVNSAAERRDSYSVFDLYAVWEPGDGFMKGLRVDLGVRNRGFKASPLFAHASGNNIVVF